MNLFRRTWMTALASGAIATAGAQSPETVPPARTTPPTAATQKAEKSLSAADRVFLQNALKSGREEVRDAELAIRQTRNEQIRKAAHELLTDHAATNTKIAALLEKGGAAAQTTESAPALPAQSLGATRFEDLAYVTAQIAAHEQAIAMFEKQSSMTSDPEVRALAEATLPKLRHHLTMMRELSTKTD